MEHIKEALDKARASFDGPPSRTTGFAALKSIQAANRQDLPIWSPRQVDLDSNRLVEQRIVSQTPEEPSHAAFNLLRTRIRKTLTDNRWRTLAITSPTPGCGKTMISLNLAFSLARAPQCRTVLIDLDLRKPSVARTLKIRSFGSIHRCLSGDIAARDVFVKVNENLILGLN
ncbi:MAG: CpsD/CapB family tyrosine-protein kinase, partial [bacterium]|nr:CpsD/CapB family tyrosine-protein kinase [bacterium]